MVKFFLVLTLSAVFFNWQYINANNKTDDNVNNVLLYNYNNEKKIDHNTSLQKKDFVSPNSQNELEKTEVLLKDGMEDFLGDKIYKSIFNIHLKKIFSISNLTEAFFIFLRLLFIALMTVLLWRCITRAANKLMNHVLNGDKYKNGKQYYDEKLVVETATPIVQSTLHGVLIIISALLCLAAIGIDVMPIIYSFGVVGLAISIGSQALVKDLINGILTLFEGNIAVGEIVSIGNSTGTIESISLRCIELRHGTGQIQVIPFSEVNNLQNLSRDFALAKISFAVSHDADLKIVDQAILDVFEEMKKDDTFGHMIQEEIKLLGVTALTEVAVHVLAIVKINPDPYQKFARRFNYKLLARLQALRVPFPKLTTVTLN